MNEQTTIPQLLAVDQALARVVVGVAPLGSEDVPLAATAGRVLAVAVDSPISLPSFANSAMDGYAVLAQDLQFASAADPVRLPIVTRIAAGQVATNQLLSGQAMCIMTGAALPAGADAVVKFEDTVSIGDSHVEVRAPVPVGMHIRWPGEDLMAGSPALAAGTVLNPAAVGLLAALGYAAVPCVRRPRVAILVTGDEIVAPGQPLSPGKIYDGNSLMLAGLVQRCGGEVVWQQVVADDAPCLRAALAAVLEAHPDLIVTTGGVAVGDFDLVKRVLAEVGTIDFWQVRMRPGRPLAFGRMHNVPLLGLPGNVVAAFVGFQVFGRALLAALQGLPSDPVLYDAICAEPIRNGSDRRNFLRGIAIQAGAQIVVRQAGGQGPNHLSTLAHSNCLIVASEDIPLNEVGATVKILLLEPGLAPPFAMGMA